MNIPLTNTKQLKELNVDALRCLLRTHHQVTKTDLAKLSGLSIATCGNTLREMLETEEVFEVALAKSTGGRPAKTYLLNKDYHHIAALYARRENHHITLTYQVTNLTGDIVSEQSKTMATMTLETLQDMIVEIITNHPAVHTCAIGLPGVIRDGYVSSCDIVNLHGVELKEHLSARYQLDFVIENDVNATVLGFYNRLQNNKSESTVYIYYPTSDSLGSGIIINGHILYGMSNYAGEAAFLPYMDYSGNSDMATYDPLAFAMQSAKTLMAYICIINPNNIVLSGYHISPPLMEHIQSELDKLCPKVHQPTLHFEPDIKDSYLHGLTKLAMDQLTFNLIVTTKY